MGVTEVAEATAALAIGDPAKPPIGLMPGWDLDDVVAEKRIEGGRARQRGEDLQAIPADSGVVLMCSQQGQQKRIPALHRPSPQTMRRAASKTGSWMSTCP